MKCDIYIKLRSVPALVVLTAPVDATHVLLQMTDAGYRAKKINSKTVVVEE